MRANLKKGDYIDTKLLFQNLNLTFGNVSICAENNCSYEIQNGTFETIGNNGDIDGTLKIEDKSKFDPQTNSRFFNYFDMSGSFRLDSSKENQTQKIIYYGGELKLEKRGIQPLTFPFTANVTVTEPLNTFVLKGNLQ